MTRLSPNDVPTRRTRLLENVLGDDAAQGDTFAAAAHALLVQLRSGSVNVTSASSVVDLAKVKGRPWSRYLDPSLSSTPEQGARRLMLWHDPEHAIEISGQGREWNISSGAIDSILLERDDSPNRPYEDQIEMDCGESEESTERRIAELGDALKATQIERNSAMKSVAVRDREIESLGIRISFFEKKLDRAIEKGDKEKVKRLGATERVKKVKEKIAKLKEDLSDERANLTEIRKVAKAAQRELASTASCLKTSEQRLGKAKAKADNEKKTRARLERQRDKAKQRIETLTTELESAERSQAILRIEQALMRTYLTTLGDESGRVEAELTAQVESARALGAEIRALTTTVADRDESLELSKAETQRLQSELGDLSQRHRAAADEARRLQEQLMELHTELGRVLPRRYLKRLGLSR